jgi:hypothetical protein
VIAEFAGAHERDRAHHRASIVAREGPFLERRTIRIIGIFEVSQDQAEVAAQRKKGLRRLERYAGIVGIGRKGCGGRNGIIVDRHRAIADDELHPGIFRRYDLAHAFGPYRAVEIADALHLHHEFVLTERRILRAQPIEALGRPQPLDIDIFEQILEAIVPGGSAP